jgi:hypothetical protein
VADSLLSRNSVSAHEALSKLVAWCDRNDWGAVPEKLEAMCRNALISETKDAADAARWRALKEMSGYYQDGSQTTVKLYQDDALRSCFIEAGGKTYGTDGSSFDSAIDSYRHTKED